MKLEKIKTRVQDVQKGEQVSLRSIPSGYDFETHSLFEAALLLESELTKKSPHEAASKLLLQQVILKSTLVRFKDANLGKLTALLDHVYQSESYKGDWETFYKIANCFISKVLMRRKGVSITLGIILIKFLEANGFEAYGVCFSRDLIIKVYCENEFIYIDPFSGEIQNWDQLEAKMRGYLGNHVKLNIDMLNVDSHEMVIKNLISVMKVAYLQARQFELALICCDILLRIDPDNAFERRERGCLFQELNCVALAVKDFQIFIDRYPNDPTVSILEKQIKKMRFNQPVIH
jgi:regulator of sirC expression with transglutaminase-like and TPR domain